MKRVGLFLLSFLFVAAPAMADTLYVAGPPPAAPGHPLRLGPDHRASQVGDLVGVQFNFAVANSSSRNITSGKTYNVALAGGTGNAALSFLRFPTAIGGTTGSQSQSGDTGSNSFTAAMMATVTDVLPSGALQIEGDQNLLIDGQRQRLHVSGMIRPEDIDQSDTVPSSRIANLDGRFDGNFKDNRGLLRRILDWLF